MKQAIKFLEFVAVMITALGMFSLSLYYASLGHEIGFLMGAINLSGCILLLRRVPEMIKEIAK